MKNVQQIVSQTLKIASSCFGLTVAFGTLSCTGLKNFSSNQTPNKISTDETLPTSSTPEGEKVHSFAKDASIGALFMKGKMADTISMFSEGSVAPESRSKETKTTIDPQTGDSVSEPFSTMSSADRNFGKFELGLLGLKSIKARISLIPFYATGHGWNGQSQKYTYNDEALKNVVVLFDISLFQEWKKEDYVNATSILQGRFEPVSKWESKKSGNLQDNPDLLKKIFSEVGTNADNTWARYYLTGRPLPLKYARTILIHPKQEDKFTQMLSDTLELKNPELYKRLLGMTRVSESLSLNWGKSADELCGALVQPAALEFATQDLAIDMPRFDSFEMQSLTKDPTGKTAVELRTYVATVAPWSDPAKTQKVLISASYLGVFEGCKVTAVKVTQ